MRLYFELSPREIEMQMQPIIAMPIISRGEPNTETVHRQTATQKGVGKDGAHPNDEGGRGQFGTAKVSK
jgi:hypothetical protein